MAAQKIFDYVPISNLSSIWHNGKKKKFKGLRNSPHKPLQLSFVVIRTNLVHEKDVIRQRCMKVIFSYMQMTYFISIFQYYGTQNYIFLLDEG